jgi:uncharacterized membrane protein (DUF485 family)
MDDATVARIRSNPKFVELVATRKSFAWTLTIIMLLIYYGFIALVAFVPGLIGTSVSGQITLGLTLGVAVIVSAVMLTGIYVWRANGEFDRLSREIAAPAPADLRHPGVAAPALAR